jgi:acyl carrier protein
MPANADRPMETLRSRDLVLAEIKQMVAQQNGAALATLQEDTDLMADLGYDSLDVAELLMNLEEHFNIVVADERVDKTPTIGRIADTVMELLARSG